MATSLDPISNKLLIGCKSLAALFIMASFASAGAQTSWAAERGTPEERRACTPDVIKHCSAFIPDPDRITVCLVRTLRDLSPECRVVMTGARTH